MLGLARVVEKGKVEKIMEQNPQLLFGDGGSMGGVERGKWLSLKKQSQGAAGPSLEGSAWLGSLLTEMERKWRRFRAAQQIERPRKA